MRARMGIVSGLAALALLLPLAASAQNAPDKTPKKDYSQPGHWQFIPFVGWTVFAVFQVELRRWLSDDNPNLRQGLQTLERALRLLITGLAPQKAALASSQGPAGRRRK